MTLEDIAPMLRLQKMLSAEKPPYEYPKRNMEKYIEHMTTAINFPKALFFIALESEAAGYVLAWIVDRIYMEPREYCFFAEIYVLPEFRSSHIGSRLLEAVFKAASECGVEEFQTADTVDPSRWDRFGFATYGYVKLLRAKVAQQWIRRSA